MEPEFHFHTIGGRLDGGAEGDFIWQPALMAHGTVGRARPIDVLDDDILLVLEESGPAPQQAAALESLLFSRDLFRVQSVANWPTLQPGQRTRVMIFAQNLRLNQGETASDVIVNLVDGSNQRDGKGRALAKCCTVPLRMSRCRTKKGHRS